MCYGYDIRVSVSLIIFHDSFRTNRNHGSIHNNVEVLRNILYREPVLADLCPNIKNLCQLCLTCPIDIVTTSDHLLQNLNTDILHVVLDVNPCGLHHKQVLIYYGERRRERGVKRQFIDTVIRSCSVKITCNLVYFLPKKIDETFRNHTTNRKD